MPAQVFCVFCGRLVHPNDLVIVSGAGAHESCADAAKKKA